LPLVAAGELAPETRRPSLIALGTYLIIVLVFLAIIWFFLGPRFQLLSENPAINFWEESEPVAATPVSLLTQEGTNAPIPSQTTLPTATPTLLSTSNETGTSPLPTQTPTASPSLTTTTSPRKTPSSTPSPTPNSPVERLVLINPVRNQPIRTLHDGDTVNLTDLGARNLDIEAIVQSSRIESVTFYLDGENFCLNGRCVENGAPYSMAGDAAGDYYNNWNWTSIIGERTISAVPCTKDNGQGSCDPPLTIKIMIVE